MPESFLISEGLIPKFYTAWDVLESDSKPVAPDESALPWQCECDVHATRSRLWIFAAACGDNDKLAAVNFVRCRSGVAGEGKSGFPEKFARGFVKGAEFLVEICCTDKDEAPGGHDGTTIIFRAGAGEPFRRKLGIDSEWNFPDIFACVEIDGVQSSPRWSDCGIAFGVEKLFVACKLVFHAGRRRAGTFRFFASAAPQKADQCKHLIVGEIRKAGHSAFAAFYRGRGLLG